MKTTTVVSAADVTVFTVDSSATPSNANATSNTATASTPDAGLYWMPHSNVKSVTSLPLHVTVTRWGPLNVGGDMPGYNTDNNDNMQLSLCDSHHSTGAHTVMLSVRFTELLMQCLGKLDVVHLRRLLLLSC